MTPLLYLRFSEEMLAMLGDPIDPRAKEARDYLRAKLRELTQRG